MSFYPEDPEQVSRSETTLRLALIEIYVEGVSTSNVNKIKQLGDTKSTPAVSASDDPARQRARELADAAAEPDWTTDLRCAAMTAQKVAFAHGQTIRAKRLRS